MRINTLININSPITLLLIIFTLLISACADKSAVDKKSFLYPYIVTQEAQQGIFVEDFKNSTGEQTQASKTMAKCALLPGNMQPCDLNTVNFIGYNNPLPSKTDIMNKLIVSHQWMADRFSAALDNMPTDMYQLFGSATVILIHSDIRPAYFWSVTGAIYLDPQYLWQTDTEYNTISKEDDYRADFGNELNFISLSRYSKNGDAAWSYETRTSTDVLYSLSALLFHELAHATDQFPLSEIQNASLSSSPYSLSDTITPSSTAIKATYPLTDSILKRIALVQFKGDTATQDLISLTAQNIADLFVVDGANDDYGYLEYEDGNFYEDTAMIFEEVMMKVHYNIDREFSFADLLVDSPQYCSDLVLKDPIINRFLDASVNPRAQFIVNKLLPNNTHAGFFSSPPARGTYTYCVITPNTPNNYKSTIDSTPRILKEKLQPSHHWY